MGFGGFCARGLLPGLLAAEPSPSLDTVRTLTRSGFLPGLGAGLRLRVLPDGPPWLLAPSRPDTCLGLALGLGIAAAEVAAVVLGLGLGFDLGLGLGLGLGLPAVPASDSGLGLRGFGASMRASAPAVSPLL